MWCLTLRVMPEANILAVKYILVALVNANVLNSCIAEEPADEAGD